MIKITIIHFSNDITPRSSTQKCSANYLF